MKIRRSYLGLLVILYIVAACGQAFCSLSATDLEYKVKAGFLLNFAKFMTWPASAFTDDDSPLVIGVLGNNPFGGALRAAESKSVRGRPVKLAEVQTIDQARKCHLLYISRSQDGLYSHLLETLKNMPVVTVSDIEGFSVRQGMVEFVRNEGRLAFIINFSRAKATHIGVHATLLNLAVEVK